MEEKNRAELAATISSSLPIWSFFLGSALCAVIGAALLILPDVLQQLGISLEAFKKLALAIAGIGWLFACGFYLLFIPPLKEVYRIRSMLTDYVRLSDCSGCAENSKELKQAYSDLKTENARLRSIISGTTDNKIDAENKNCEESKGD